MASLSNSFSIDEIIHIVSNDKPEVKMSVLPLVPELLQSGTVPPDARDRVLRAVGRPFFLSMLHRSKGERPGTGLETARSVCLACVAELCVDPLVAHRLRAGVPLLLSCIRKCDEARDVACAAQAFSRIISCGRSIAGIEGHRSVWSLAHAASRFAIQLLSSSQASRGSDDQKEVSAEDADGDKPGHSGIDSAPILAQDAEAAVIWCCEGLKLAMQGESNGLLPAQEGGIETGASAAEAMISHGGIEVMASLLCHPNAKVGCAVASVLDTAIGSLSSVHDLIGTSNAAETDQVGRTLPGMEFLPSSP